MRVYRVDKKNYFLYTHSEFCRLIFSLLYIHLIFFLCAVCLTLHLTSFKTRSPNKTETHRRKYIRECRRRALLQSERRKSTQNYIHTMFFLCCCCTRGDSLLFVKFEEKNFRYAQRTTFFCVWENSRYAKRKVLCLLFASLVSTSLWAQISVTLTCLMMSRWVSQVSPTSTQHCFTFSLFELCVAHENSLSLFLSFSIIIICSR